MRLPFHSGICLLLLFLTVSLLVVSSVAGGDVISGQSTTVTLVVPSVTEHVVSEVLITADDAVKEIGYTVNGQPNLTYMEISGKDTTHITIKVTSLPQWATLNTTLTYLNKMDVLKRLESTDYPFELQIDPHGKSTTFNISLALGGENPDAPPSVGPSPDGPSTPGSGTTPSVPDLPNVPDTPSDPEHPDTPGSDEPYRPILPPADSVYNFAGFIPLLAGFLLLLLLFFLRGNLVYRILVKNAKKHGDKPDKEEKEHLKQIASAIVSRIRDEEKYPEWRKNTDLMKRLWFDIESVLDEMNYARAVPRGALVAEIIKAARGRINRHRL